MKRQYEDLLEKLSRPKLEIAAQSEPTLAVDSNDKEEKEKDPINPWYDIIENVIFKYLDLHSRYRLAVLCKRFHRYLYRRYYYAITNENINQLLNDSVEGTLRSVDQLSINPDGKITKMLYNTESIIYLWKGIRLGDIYQKEEEQLIVQLLNKLVESFVRELDSDEDDLSQIRTLLNIRLSCVDCEMSKLLSYWHLLESFHADEISVEDLNHIFANCKRLRYLSLWNVEGNPDAINTDIIAFSSSLIRFKLTVKPETCAKLFPLAWKCSKLEKLSLNFVSYHTLICDTEKLSRLNNLKVLTLCEYFDLDALAIVLSIVPNYTQIRTICKENHIKQYLVQAIDKVINELSDGAICTFVYRIMSSTFRCVSDNPVSKDRIEKNGLSLLVSDLTINFNRIPHLQSILRSIISHQQSPPYLEKRQLRIGLSPLVASLFGPERIFSQLLLAGANPNFLCKDQLGLRIQAKSSVNEIPVSSSENEMIIDTYSNSPVSLLLGLYSFSVQNISRHQLTKEETLTRIEILLKLGARYCYDDMTLYWLWNMKGPEADKVMTLFLRSNYFEPLTLIWYQVPTRSEKSPILDPQLVTVLDSLSSQRYINQLLDPLNEHKSNSNAPHGIESLLRDLAVRYLPLILAEGSPQFRKLVRNMCLSGYIQWGIRYYEISQERNILHADDITTYYKGHFKEKITWKRYLTILLNWINNPIVLKYAELHIKYNADLRISATDDQIIHSITNRDKPFILHFTLSCLYLSESDPLNYYHRRFYIEDRHLWNQDNSFKFLKNMTPPGFVQLSFTNLIVAIGGPEIIRFIMPHLNFSPVSNQKDPLTIALQFKNLSNIMLLANMISKSLGGPLLKHPAIPDQQIESLLEFDDRFNLETINRSGITTIKLDSTLNEVRKLNDESLTTMITRLYQLSNQPSIRTEQ